VLVPFAGFVYRVLTTILSTVTSRGTHAESQDRAPTQGAQGVSGRLLEVLRPHGKLAVHLSGQGDASAPVVLLPGLGADHRMWTPQVMALKDRFRVLAPDPRGHGESEAGTTPVSLATMVEDVLAVLDATGAEAAHVVGLSLGGMTALGMALDHPDRVLSVLCACARADAPEEFAKAWRTRADLVDAQGLAPLWPATAERWFAEGWRASHPSELDALRAMFLATSPGAYAALARALGQLDLARRLPELAPPALFLAGGEDRGIPPAVMQALAESVPGAGYVELAGAAHLANVDSSAAFNRCLTDWLDTRDSAQIGTQTGTRDRAEKPN